MNLETMVNERLWQSVRSSYENRHFTGAILDAIYFLSDLIREKTGLQSDGTALVGQALGGKSPKLKVNRLETESEKNIQAGIEQLLRGFYQAVRNPRSHEKHTDTQKDADAIITFINYLVGIIDQSKMPFTKSEFINRVFDPHFVEKERYAELMVAEIPTKKRLEVMLDVFRNKETGDGKKLKYFVTALLSQLSEDDANELYRIVSDELKVTDRDIVIRLILQIFPSESFTKYDETARLRIENKLIQSITEGKYIQQEEKCVAGVLGTWAMHIGKYFLLKDDLINTLVKKLRSRNVQEQDYVFQFFWEDLKELAIPLSKRLVIVLKIGLKAGNKSFYNRLSLEQMFGDKKWVEQFKQELDSFIEAEPIPDTDSEEIPF